MRDDVDRPVTIDVSETPGGPPPDEIQREIAALLRTDKTQLGIAFRAIEADPEITPSQMAERTSIANPGAAGNIRQALLAILERRIPHSPSQAQQASGRAGGLLRHPGLSRETVSYLRALRRELDRVAKTSPSRWRPPLRGVVSDEGIPAKKAVPEPNSTAALEAAHRLTDLVNLEVLLDVLIGNPSLPATLREPITNLKRALGTTRSHTIGTPGIYDQTEQTDRGGNVTPPPAPRLERIAFISYSRRDVDIANQLVSELEAAGIRTWIDHGSIGPGMSWAGAISNAIASADAFIVLLSANSVSSRHVENELSMAMVDELPVIPIRLDDSAIDGGLRYFLSGLNWVEASHEPRQAVFATLAREIRLLTPAGE